MSMKRLVISITFLAVFAMAARFSLDTDTWWHLRAGEWIVENRAVPQVDYFSYTRYGSTWQYPGWLVEAPMYAFHAAGGPGALNLWTALMVTLTFVFVWRTLSGGVFLRAFILIIAAAASGIYWAARPYLVTFLLSGVLLWILEDFRWEVSPVQETRRRSWQFPGGWLVPRRWVLLPLLMVIWANSHGGFIVGFILLGIYILTEVVCWLRARWSPVNNAAAAREHRLRSLGLMMVGLLMVLAVCLNPSGPIMLLYPFKTVAISALAEYIQEWQPPDFGSPQVLPFVALLLFAVASLGYGIYRRRLALSDFLLAAVFGTLALDAARNIALFALAAPPVIARQAAPLAAALASRFGIQPASSPPSRAQGRINLLLFIALALAAVLKALSVLPLEANRDEMRAFLPVDAVEYLRADRPPGRLFNAYNWGAYLLWALPEYPVFVDGRSDLYDDALLAEWLGVVQARPGWQEVLESWDVRLVLLEPEVPLASYLEAEGWARLYADGIAVLWGR